MKQQPDGSITIGTDSRSQLFDRKTQYVSEQEHTHTHTLPQSWSLKQIDKLTIQQMLDEDTLLLRSLSGLRIKGITIYCDQRLFFSYGTI